MAISGIGSDLLQHGLLQPSYIPDRDQRELRELVSYRRSLVQRMEWDFVGVGIDGNVYNWLSFGISSLHLYLSLHFIYLWISFHILKCFFWYVDCNIRYCSILWYLINFSIKFLLKKTSVKKDRQKELLEEYLEKRAQVKRQQQEMLNEKFFFLEKT